MKFSAPDKITYIATAALSVIVLGALFSQCNATSAWSPTVSETRLTATSKTLTVPGSEIVLKTDLVRIVDLPDGTIAFEVAAYSTSNPKVTRGFFVITEANCGSGKGVVFWLPFPGDEISGAFPFTLAGDSDVDNVAKIVCHTGATAKRVPSPDPAAPKKDDGKALNSASRA